MPCPLPSPPLAFLTVSGLVQTGQWQAWAVASGTQHLSCFCTNPSSSISLSSPVTEPCTPRFLSQAALLQK